MLTFDRTDYKLVALIKFKRNPAGVQAGLKFGLNWNKYMPDIDYVKFEGLDGGMGAYCYVRSIMH